MKTIFLFFLLFSTISYTKEYSIEEFYKKAFQNKNKEEKAYLPLKINGILHNEIYVKISKNNKIFLKKDSIEYIISLLKDKYAKKFKYNKNNKFLPLSTLNQFGIEAKYNKKDTSIDVSIPPKLTKTNLINLNTIKKEDINGSILPEKYAGGMNLYFNQYLKSEENKNNLKSNPFNLSSDIFLNLNQFVLEGRVNYKEEDKKIIRDGFKITKDNKKNYLRYEFGDIYMPSSSRMISTSAFGFSIEKNFDLNKDLNNVSKISSYEFFLKRRSRVEIFVNGKFIRALKLRAGTHNLYNLNLDIGLNEIELKIIDENGKIEYLNFYDFEYYEILKKGVAQYGIGIGIQSNINSEGIEYDYNQKLYSAYIDYGLTNNLTIKSGLEFNNDYNSEILEFFYGTNFGIFNPYILKSHINNSSGYKKGLSYRSNIKKININLGYENTDKNYKNILNYKNTLKNKNRTIYRESINIPFWKNSTIGLSMSQYKEEDKKNRKYSMVLSKQIFKNTDIKLRYNKETQNNNESIYLTLNYKIGNNRISYGNYIKDDSYQIDISHNSPTRYGFNSNFQYKNSSDNKRYNLRSIINDEKFKLDTSYNLLESTKKSQSLGVHLATGFVFAGDRATITSPINSSFVIVSNDKRLKEPLGLIHYQEDNPKYDTFAVPLSNYKKTKLSVDEKDLDFGIELLNPTQKVITEYRSGAIMDLKIKSLLSIRGKIVDEKNHPIKNSAFKIFNTRTGKKLISFTDENGNFTVSEVEIGKYNARFLKEAKYTDVIKFSFEIKDSRENLIDLGTIKVKLPPHQ